MSSAVKCLFVVDFFNKQNLNKLVSARRTSSIELFFSKDGNHFLSVSNINPMKNRFLLMSETVCGLIKACQEVYDCFEASNFYLRLIEDIANSGCGQNPRNPIK
ncbi:CLUMA_CG011744, isoform A [Clunio marinus]|uniref:CLUMA_CG011744, isoform A n=1 Tax=Clunio marinus TaxID=568069 RepID=A0A1J1IIV6_9DIPT|nr:CLUMA_CG011744, isoform A [Clunio marinus]